MHDILIGPLPFFLISFGNIVTSFFSRLLLHSGVGIFFICIFFTLCADVSCCCSSFGVTVSHVVMPGNDYTLEYFGQQHPEAVARVVIIVLL